MTHAEAVEILNLVRAGDKSPTWLQITMALARTGDLS